MMFPSTKGDTVPNPRPGPRIDMSVAVPVSGLYGVVPNPVAAPSEDNESDFPVIKIDVKEEDFSDAEIDLLAEAAAQDKKIEDLDKALKEKPEGASFGVVLVIALALWAASGFKGIK